MFTVRIKTSSVLLLAAVWALLLTACSSPKKELPPKASASADVMLPAVSADNSKNKIRIYVDDRTTDAVIDKILLSELISFELEKNSNSDFMPIILKVSILQYNCIVKQQILNVANIARGFSEITGLIRYVDKKTALTIRSKEIRGNYNKAFSVSRQSDIDKIKDAVRLKAYQSFAQQVAADYVDFEQTKQQTRLHKNKETKE